MKLFLKHYVIVKIITSVAYGVVAIAGIVAMVMKFNQTDKFYAVGLAIIIAIFWFVFLVITIVRLLNKLTPDAHRDFLIVLSIFQLIPMFVVINLTFSILKGEEFIWGYPVIILFNLLYVLNVCKPHNWGEAVPDSS